MVNIRKQSFISFTDDGKNRIIAEIYVDDVSELPARDGIDGYELAQGSIVYVVRSGELYIMDGNGVWYSSDGTPAAAVSEVANES